MVPAFGFRLTVISVVLTSCLLGLPALLSEFFILAARPASAPLLMRTPARSSSESAGRVSSTGAGGETSREAATQAEATKLPAATKARPITTEERADIHLAKKEYARAIDNYRAALQERGFEDAYLWNKLGIAYQMNTNVDSAREAYKKAARLKRDFAEPWNNLGTTYYLENKFRKSTKYYKRAIKLRPEVASFHMNLAGSFSRLGKSKKAIGECREALRLDPDVLVKHSATAAAVQARGPDAEFYYYLAKVFASMARWDEAVRYLRRALEEGFRNMKRLDRDPDFQKISHYPAFVELRKNPPLAIED